MKFRRLYVAGFAAVSGLGGVARAQVPVAPAGPVPAAAVAAGVAPAPLAPAQPMTLWSFLGVSKAQKQACKDKLCATPAGAFLNNMFAPATAFSGGIIPPCCPPLIPTAEELADPGAVGTAAAIKAEEAKAKARRAAMRYLGTVDCVRFPDAGKALVAGLRKDTNECVRYEAALALGNGCCCNKETMEALAISAACSDRDKNPRETSDRVRAAAVAALQNCLACFVDPNPPAAPVEKPVEPAPLENRPAEQLPPPVDPPPAGATSTSEKKDTSKVEPKKAEPMTSEAYYARIREVPRQLIIDEARRVVEKYNQTASAQAVLSRHSSLVNVVNRSLSDNPDLPPVVMENGVPVVRAAVAHQRPQNLWELLTRDANPVSEVPVVTTKVETVKNTAEPPAIVPVPVITMIDPAPSKVESAKKSEPPAIVPVPVIGMPVPSAYAPMDAKKADPLAMKYPEPIIINKPERAPVATPANAAALADMTGAGRYGERRLIRPKTPAELAGQVKAEKGPAPLPQPAEFVGPVKVEKAPAPLPKPAEIVGQIKADNPLPPLPKAVEPVVAAKADKAAMPNTMPKPSMPVALPLPLPAAVTNEAISPSQQQGLKPVDFPKPETNGSELTPLAKRALTVFREVHPASVRCQLAESLTAADLKSCPDLTGALLSVAAGTDPEATRRSAIKSLVRCGASTPDVLSALDKLTEDANPAVRVEAAIGMARLKVGQPGR